jgi:hypothetical protein
MMTIQTIFLAAAFFPSVAAYFSEGPQNGVIGKFSFNGVLGGTSGGETRYDTHGITQTVDRFFTPNNAALFASGYCVTSLTQFNPTTLSVSFWINPSESKCNTAILDNGDWSVQNYVRDSTTVNCNEIVFTQGRNARTVPMTIPPNQWTHVVFVRQPLANGKYSVKIYRNGVEIPSSGIYDASEIGSPGAQAPFVVGASLSAANFFKGKIDDIYIYNRALSLAEVQALYANYASSDAVVNRCQDTSKFAAVKYYKFEVSFLKTLEDGGHSEEYQLHTNTNYIRLHDNTNGWLVMGGTSATNFPCTAGVNSLSLYKYTSGACTPPDNSNDPEYACGISFRGFTNTEWYFVVPVDKLPSKFDFFIENVEWDDGTDEDAGSTVTWQSTYTNSESVNDLSYTKDTPRYFTKTSADNRIQRFRYEQRLVCLSHSDFDFDYFCDQRYG